MPDRAYLNMDIDKLVYFVEKEPQLYDNKSSTYSDKQLRENTWTRIGENMGFSGKSHYLTIFIFSIEMLEYIIRSFLNMIDSF